MTQPYLRVFGSNDWIPQPGNDGSWYALDGAMLIDTGWRGVSSMIDADLDATEYPLQLFTHLHADHKLALPQLMMYWFVHKGAKGLAELTLAGPEEILQECYQNAHKFVFSAPDEPGVAECKLALLAAGGTLKTDTHFIECIRAIHGTPALSYKITHRQTGHQIGISGDTAYNPASADFFRGCSVLVHECTLGDVSVPIEKRGLFGHSSIFDAVRVAKDCGAKQLMLTHCPKDHAAILRIARAEIDIAVDFAEPGMIVEY